MHEPPPLSLDTSGVTFSSGRQDRKFLGRSAAQNNRKYIYPNTVLFRYSIHTHQIVVLARNLRYYQVVVIRRASLESYYDMMSCKPLPRNPLSRSPLGVPSHKQQDSCPSLLIGINEAASIFEGVLSIGLAALPTQFDHGLPRMAHWSASGVAINLSTSSWCPSVRS